MLVDALGGEVAMALALVLMWFAMMMILARCLIIRHFTLTMCSYIVVDLRKFTTMLRYKILKVQAIRNASNKWRY